MARMRDQTGLIRDVVKWDYELRYRSKWQSGRSRYGHYQKRTGGPVYLGLPRSRSPSPGQTGWPSITLFKPFQHDRRRIRRLSFKPQVVEKAHHPLIICQRGDPGGRLSQVLSDLAAKHAIPVVRIFRYKILLSAHPMQSGFDAGTWLKDADIVLAIDTEVPWIQRHQSPGKGAKIIHLGLTLCSPECPPGVIRTISQLCRTR